MALYALTKSQSDRIAKTVRAVEADVIPGQKWAKNIAASKGNVYAGQFAVALKAGSTTIVTVAAGRVIEGGNVSSVAAAEVTPSGDGTHYLYAEIYYTTSWQIGYVSSTTYPTQAVKNVDGTDYPCLRVLIAELVVTVSAISSASIKQQHFGEIHVAGRWI